MTDDFSYELSRRKILAALGTIGAAGAGTGLGTSAFFSDTETVSNNSLVAGELDLQVAVSQHYVDWLADTDGNASPPAPQETDDAELADSDPDIRLGTGAAGRGDTQASPIELDLIDDGEDDGDAEDDPSDEPALEFAIGSKVNEINGGVQPADRGESLCTISGGFDDDDAERPIVQLEDVKPGDFGFIRFEFASCDNPAFVRLNGTLESSAENGTTEPESEDEDEVADEVELLDEVQLALLDGDVYQILSAGGGADISSGQGFAGDVPVTLGTLLREGGEGEDADPVVEPLEGDIPPEAGGGTGDLNCFSAETNHRRTLVWWVPVDHANEIQTDSATFSLGLHAEQCRHNSAQGASSGSDSDSDALEFEPVATQPSPGRVELAAGEQEAGTTAATEVPATELVSGSGISLRSVSVDLGSGSTMDVTVEQDATPDGPVPEGFDPFGFFSIAHPRPRDEDVESVRFGISVERDRIDAPTLFSVLRYDEERGEWVPLPTELTGKTATQCHYQVTSPGLSKFAPVAAVGTGDVRIDGAEVRLPDEDPRADPEVVVSTVGPLTTPTEVPPDVGIILGPAGTNYPRTQQDAFEIVNEGETTGYYDAKTTAEYVTVSTGGSTSDAARGETRRLEPGERVSADITVEPIEPENQLWVTLNLPTYIDGREADKGPILGGEGENAGPPNTADEECLNEKRAPILVNQDAYVPSASAGGGSSPSWLPPGANTSKAHYQIPGILSVRSVGNISEDLRITITQSQGDLDADLIDVNLRGSGEDFEGSEVIEVSGDTLRDEGTVRKEIGLNFESNVPACTQVLDVDDDLPGGGILECGGISSLFAYEYVGNIELEVTFDENDSEWQERTGENSHTSSLEYYTSGKSMAECAQEFAKNAVELWAELTKAVIFPGGPLKMYRAFRAVTLGTSSLGRAAPLVGLWDGLSEISNFFDTPPITPSGLIQNEILDEKNYDFVFGGASDTFEELDQGVDVVEEGFKEPIVGVGTSGPSLYFAARGNTQIAIGSFQTDTTGNASADIARNDITGNGLIFFFLDDCDSAVRARRRLGILKAALVIRFEAFGFGGILKGITGGESRPELFFRVLNDGEVIFEDRTGPTNGTLSFEATVGVDGEVVVEFEVAQPDCSDGLSTQSSFTVSDLEIEAVSLAEFL